MSEPPLVPWIILSEDGSILSAHCICMAGLDEVCSHVAALSFAVFRKKENELSCTEQLCKWNEPKVNTTIKFKRLKDVDSGKPLKSYNQKKVPTLEGKDLIKFLHKVNKIEPNAPILRVIEPFASMRVKDANPNLPGYLTDLYDEKYSNLTLEDLRKVKVNINLSKEQVNAIFLHTLEQSKKSDWYKYRRGRITASVFKKSCTTSIEKPAISTIKLICYSPKLPPKIKSISYGIEHEPIAKAAYKEKIELYHQGIKLEPSGLMIWEKNPEFGALPDAIVECNCCGYGCVDKEWEDWLATPNCFIKKYPDGSLYLDKDHEYYYQVQLQIFCTQTNYCDFVVWSKDCLFISRILPNEQFMKHNIEKASAFHKNVIIPELLSRYYTDSKDKSTIYVFCYCCQPQNGKRMIRCTSNFCETKWFHFDCIKSKNIVNESLWVCPQCLENEAFELALSQVIV